MKFLLALVAILLLPLQAWSAGNEALCDSLGSDCLCSEPLNFLGGGVGTIQTINPPDTTTKECGTVGMVQPSKFAMVAGSTKGLGGLTGIIQTTGLISAPSELKGVQNHDFTDGTLCIRYYVNWDGATWSQALINRAGAGNDNDIKDHRAIGLAPRTTGAPELQCIWGTGNSFGSFSCAHGGLGPFHSVGDPYTLHTSGLMQSTGAGIQGCLDDWCRVEICYDHNSRGGGDADKLFTRARVTRIGDGQVWSESVLSGNSFGVAISGDAGGTTTVKIPSFDMPDWGGSPTPETEGAKRWYTHTMMATQAIANESWWIGAATEVEGGTPGPTWFIDTAISETPDVCTKGTNCDNISLSATADGTATGTITWDIDCDLGGGFVTAACSGGNNQATCTDATTCDYDTETAATYQPAMRSTRESVTPPPTVGSLLVQDAAAGNLLFSANWEGSASDFTDGGHCSTSTCASTTPEAWSIGTTAPPEGTQYATSTCNSGLGGNLLLIDKFSATELWITAQINADGVSGDPGGHLFYITDATPVHPCGQIGLQWTAVGTMTFDMCDSDALDPQTPVAVTDNAWGTHKFYMNTVTGVGGWWPPGSTMANAAPEIVQGSTDPTAMTSIRMFRQITANCADVNNDDWNVYSEDPDGAPTPTISPPEPPADPTAPRLVGASPGSSRN